MIVKYLKDGVWGFIDNVRQASSKDIDCNQAVIDYDNARSERIKEAKENGWPIEKDLAEYLNDEELAESIIASNKVFVHVTTNQSNWGNCVHSENLLDGQLVLENYPATVILLYVEEHKEYDSIALVTNQKAYLMNDKGQTIERLV